MKISNTVVFLILISLLATSCVSKKKFLASQNDLDARQKELASYIYEVGELKAQLEACEDELFTYRANAEKSEGTIKERLDQIQDLKNQLSDYKAQRDQQFAQIEDLTVLTQSANDNIGKTLAQLEKRDKYIHLLQAAKSKTDSINLALAINLKSELAEGLADNDVDIKLDKTVVFINLSDKMLYKSGSSNLTLKANEVLGKIAKIVASRPDLEIMVEGYTDNVPIRNSCLQDNWDLSVKRATSVVRVLQNKYGVNPDNLIAAGRGEYNRLAENDTAEGRSINRRTRIIILPKLKEFYDLLNPNNMPK